MDTAGGGKRVVSRAMLLGALLLLQGAASRLPPGCEADCRRDACRLVCRGGSLPSLGTLLASLPPRALPWRELDVSSAPLGALRRRDVTGSPFTAVRRLRLREDNIARVEPGALTGLADLRELHLGSNPLLDWSVDSDSLERLYLDSCGLPELPEGVFDHLPRLHDLNLSDNLLVRLPPGLFRLLPFLRHLHLSANFLSTLSPDTFDGLHRLKLLNLTDNRISHLHGDVFSQLHDLENVHLSYNTLKTLDPNTFSTASSLVKIDLSYNHLEDLQDGLFRPLENLRSVSLRNNRLTTLRLSTFRDLLDNAGTDSLRTGSEFSFDVTGNPWHCSGCEMASVFRWLRSNSSADAHFLWDVMVCASPAALRGRSWTIVPWTDSANEECVDSRFLAEMAEREPSSEVDGNARSVTETHENGRRDTAWGCSRASGPEEGGGRACAMQVYLLSSYALFVLLCACAMLYFIYRRRARESVEAVAV